MTIKTTIHGAVKITVSTDIIKGSKNGDDFSRTTVTFVGADGRKIYEIDVLGVSDVPIPVIT